MAAVHPATRHAAPAPNDASRLMLHTLRRLDAAFEAAAEHGARVPTLTELRRIRSLAQVAIEAAERESGGRA